MPEERDLCRVIDQCLAHVPDRSEYAMLRQKAEDIKYNAAYVAPEGRSQLWAEWAMNLAKALGEPDWGWKQIIQSIMRGPF